MMNSRTFKVFGNRLAQTSSSYLALIALGAASIGCQSTAKFSDKSAEITALETQKASMVSNQEDILAPKEYREFTVSLDKAKQLNDQQKDSSPEVSRSKKLLGSIQEKSKPTKAILTETLNARNKAIVAGASTTESFKKTDKDLISATEDAAKGDISGVQKNGSEYTNRYTNAEGDMIVIKAIGDNQQRFEALKTQNAEAVAPKTFARSQTKLMDAERSIRADRYNDSAIASAKELTAFEVKRLEKITADANRLKNEPAAVEIFEKDQAVLALKKKTDNQAQMLESKDSQLTATESEKDATASQLATAKTELEAANAESTKKQALEQKFADAKKIFLAGEAEVYKDGDNLLIRLNGLSFVPGKGTLPAESKALLKKLGTVVADFGRARIRVEGHTDSTGSAKANAKISAERALVVKEYLVSERISTADDVVAQGLGEAGPVASNKTAQGRAQNRRVDVIVQPIY